MARSKNKRFLEWSSHVPLTPQDNHALGEKLGWFFQEGRQLVDMNRGSAQQVVDCLSQEGGSKRLRELIDRDFTVMKESKKMTVFAEQMLPFLEMITHRDVLTSILLEREVGKIYNFIFGQEGQCAVKLLSYLCDVLTLMNKETKDNPNAKGKGASLLESILVFLKQVVYLNSTAILCGPLKAVVRRFEAIYLSIESSKSGSRLVGARSHLEDIQRRLNTGTLFLKAKPPTKTKSSTKPDGLVLPCERPGGRHDNDHSDICQIKIMPTLQEIRSTRREYLPPRDPSQWHIDGVAGLLDRNFRLLREDTVGQLREAIHYEIVSSPNAPKGPNELKTHVYKNAQIESLDMDIFQGLRIQMAFPQPAVVQRLNSKGAREERWKLSKRLQTPAMVFLTDYDDFAVFCTVSGPKTEPPKWNNDRTPTLPTEESMLWADPQVARVVLGLVETDGPNVRKILRAYKSSTLSMIEFPGVLLQSFQSTLQALQWMQQTARLPFADIFTTQSDISPPLYALKPGFSFNLQCLMRNGRQLDLYPGRPFDIKRLYDQCDLDEAQAEALVNSLQRKISLIQGPPGTGKSFTGVSLVKVLLANKKKAKMGPILCVCYTNHALDQFLEDLLKKNITTKIVRVGSRSQSEIIEPFKLRNLAENYKKTNFEKPRFTQLRGQLQGIINGFPNVRLNNSNSWDGIVNFIRKKNPTHYTQIFEEDAQGWRKYSADGQKGALRNWLHEGELSNSQPRSVANLQNEHVNAMTQQERKVLYLYWTNEAKEEIYARGAAFILNHAGIKSSFDKIRNERDLRCLENADVIGVTTTGLAQNLDMLRRLQSKVLICEEAGEVIEAHFLTTLMPSLEHAILIGDHLQLRPRIQNYDFSVENPRGGDLYALDVSLFERLVDTSKDGLRIPFSTLEIQRRMHPSIADLIRNTLYPKLKDAPSVSKYPRVLGMRRRLFWLDHWELEADPSGNDTSHWNQHEVGLTIAFVMHLTSQGKYEAGDIAVLTPYLGQLQRLRTELQRFFTISVGERDQDELDQAGFANGENTSSKNIVKENLLQSVRVATVDNFQGEEAKVIVISLVRSNRQNKCGFLRTSNRINVLLSRAKHGMYIIGNAETSGHVPMWAEVIKMFRQADNIGPKLELQCSRHPDTIISVSQPGHFTQFSPEGGCNLRCIKRLSCGHPCAHKCHSEALHDAVDCYEDCPKPMKECGHPCPKRCSDPCPVICTYKVHDSNRFLSCGHSVQNLPCWQVKDRSAVRCPVMVVKTVPGCNHQVTEECWVNVNSFEYRCKNECKSKLPCGHSCKLLCHHCFSRDNTDEFRTDHGTCIQECGRSRTTCAHVCRTVCHGMNTCPPCGETCDVRCGHSKCSKKCHEPCIPCTEDECLSACPHTKCSMPCSAPCDHVPCSKRCKKTLTCGHQCPSVCGETCPSVKFCQICGDEKVKDTMADFIMRRRYFNIDLNKNPCIFPRCGHFLTMKCMDAHLDLKKYYDMDTNGKPIAIASSSKPFSIDEEKTCAACQGPLLDIARYGRIIRRALLDESTKKFILFFNNEYIVMAEDLSKVLNDLRGSQVNKTQYFKHELVIKIDGSCNSQIKTLSKVMSVRWREALLLRERLVDYRRKASQEEQPFQEVRNKVEDARRRKMADINFEFDEIVLQTKGVLVASTLLIRLDTSLIADFLTLLHKTTETGGITKTLSIDLKKNRQHCEHLIQSAAASMVVSPQVEGLVFLAQLCALEYPSTEDVSIGKNLVESGLEAVEKATELCTRYPGQTAGLLDEVDGTRSMLNQGTFYIAVTNGERLAAIKAMASESCGIGSWHYCTNGHAFTTGGRGMPIKTSVCPDCGAPVAGQQVTGEQRVEDLEEALQNLRI